MIARSFKPVGFVAAVGASALGCYLLSLQVAAERSELAALERRIIETRQSIRSLQTELGTRGRLQQLERWNAEVLALSAPLAHQYLDSNVSLARFDVNAPSFDGGAQIRMAAAGGAAPSGQGQTAAQPAIAAPSPVAAAPTVRLASARTAPTPAAPERPVLRRASLVVDLPDAVQPVSASSPDSGLLDEGTLSELRTRSRSETRERPAN